jgi:hypothetical protein
MTGIENSILRTGFDSEMDKAEARKSGLLLEASILREQGDEEAAARLFAEAAEVEESLGSECRSRGLPDKAFVHLFSAASAWAQAGNFYQAINICGDLLTGGVSDRLRLRVEEYSSILHERRSAWYSELLARTSTSELPLD